MYSELFVMLWFISSQTLGGQASWIIDNQKFHSDTFLFAGGGTVYI